MIVCSFCGTALTELGLQCTKCSGRAIERPTPIRSLLTPSQTTGSPDRWAQRYTSPTASPTSKPIATSPSGKQTHTRPIPPSPLRGSRSSTHTSGAPLAQRSTPNSMTASSTAPRSASTLNSATFDIMSGPEETAELARVYGSVLDADVVHPSCKLCHTDLKQGSKLYLARREITTHQIKVDDTLCKTCYSLLFSIGTCRMCKKAILGEREEGNQGVHVSGRAGMKWHAHCYVCTGCDLPLLKNGSDQGILLPSGLPSCEACFDNLCLAAFDRTPPSTIASTNEVPRKYGLPDKVLLSSSSPRDSGPNLPQKIPTIGKAHGRAPVSTSSLDHLPPTSSSVQSSNAGTIPMGQPFSPIPADNRTFTGLQRILDRFQHSETSSAVRADSIAVPVSRPTWPLAVKSSSDRAIIDTTGNFRQTNQPKNVSDLVSRFNAVDKQTGYKLIRLRDKLQSSISQVKELDAKDVGVAARKAALNEEKIALRKEQQLEKTIIEARREQARIEEKARRDLASKEEKIRRDLHRAKQDRRRTIEDLHQAIHKENRRITSLSVIEHNPIPFNMNATSTPCLRCQHQPFAVVEGLLFHLECVPCRACGKHISTERPLPPTPPMDSPPMNVAPVSISSGDQTGVRSSQKRISDFGSQPCPGCSVKVATQEKESIRGPNGFTWHKKCLRCGTGSSLVSADKKGCGKPLDYCATLDEEGRVWCRMCLLSAGKQPRIPLPATSPIPKAPPKFSSNTTNDEYNIRRLLSPQLSGRKNSIREALTSVRPPNYVG